MASTTVVGLVLAALTLGRPSSTAPEPGSSAPASSRASAPASAPAPAPPKVKGGRPEMFDAHVHFTPDGLPRLLALMKQHGIAHIVNLSGGHPKGGLSQQLAAARASGGKITVFTGLAYEQAEAPGYGERMARLLAMAHEMGARGLKVAKALGLGLPRPDGRLMPVDDPGLDVVFETAGRLGMPVAIHSGDPRAFWLPVDEKNERRKELTAHPGWRLHGRKVPSFDEILSQLERRIARHPSTTFISVHFGNCAEDVDRVAALLRKYPNMRIDTAARIPEMGRHPREKLQAFFREFQDRIHYGSDLGVGEADEPLFLGSSGPEPATSAEEALFFSATRRFFETSDRAFAHPTPIQGDWTIDGIDLPRPILEKVYAENTRKLLGLPGTRP